MNHSPLFSQLIEDGFLTYLDLYFAQMHQVVGDAERAFFAAAMQAAREGHLCLDLEDVAVPQGVLGEKWKSLVLEGAEKRIDSPNVVVEDGRVYLQKNYEYESDILAELRRLQGADVLPTIQAQLTEEQQAAFDLVRREKVSIIAGGPGTGKTHLITELVKSFGGRVILAAPTGKAAGRLREKNPGAICGTLHAILGLKSERDLEERRAYLKADLVVVDEASMIDVRMMRAFLRSLQTGQRIVFLGDGNQLPPVESGSVFSDLIGMVPSVHLHTSLRSDRKEILGLAQSILEGKNVPIQGALSFDAIRNFAASHKNCAILTPVREGPWGVKELNEKLDQEFRAMKKPMMITRNDRITGLSNGDMGEMVFSGGKPVRAYFEIGEFAASQLPSYELAYVLSVHKSQGSEFDHVLVLVPPGTEAFGREVLYTAVTRARFSVTLLGEESVVTQTLKRSSSRKSGLKKKLKLPICLSDETLCEQPC